MSTEKKEKRILLVGRSGCGKTTLADTITHGSATYHKTQAITRVGNFIDTPGEYMENPNYYRGIILHAYDADVVIFMIPAGDETTIFPPNFGNSLNREVIGVVSKVDTGKDVEAPRRNLKLAGATNIFEIYAAEYPPIAINPACPRFSCPISPTVILRLTANNI